MEPAVSVPTPTLFAELATAPALLEAGLPDLELACTTDAVPRIRQDDRFAYSSNPPYDTLYTLATDGSGGGYHLWAGAGGSCVVHIGSEGERAKVGRTASQFLQLSLSLQPHWPDCVHRLPGINTLPGNGDIVGATAADFDADALLALIAVWTSHDPEEVAEARAKADTVLAAVGLERLSGAAALAQLCDAHLAAPRFAVRSEDDEDDDADGDE